MATVVEVMARFGADTSNFRTGVNSANESMRRLKQTANETGTTTEKSMGGMQTKAVALGSMLGTLAANGFARVAAGAAQFGKEVLTQAMNLQQAKIAFTNFLGSAEKADKFLKQVADFAAKTPFEFPELVQASKQMMAFGFATEQVIPMMTAIGDAAAGLGAGSDGIERITRQLGQMKMKGLAAGEEMRVIAEVGVPAWQYLADTLNVDVATAMKMVEKRTVSADFAIQAIVTGMEKGTKAARGFGGMMDAQSRTLQGVLSTFKDSVMNSLVAALDPIIAGMTNAVAAATPMAEALSKGIGGAITVVVNGLTALTSLLSPVVSLLTAIPTPVWAGVAAMLAFNLAGKAASAIMSRLIPEGGLLVRVVQSLRDAWRYAGQAAVQSGGQQAGTMAKLKAFGSIMSGGAVKGAINGVKAAGSALFGLMGGPWGVAIGGAVLGLQMYQQAQENAQAAVDALTESMNKQTGQFTDESYLQIAKALQADITKSEEWEALNKRGLGLKEAVAAIMTGGQRLEDFQARLDSVGAGYDDTARLADMLGNSVSNQLEIVYDAQQGWQASKVSVDAAAEAMTGAGVASAGLASTQESLKTATEAADKAAQHLTETWKILQGIIDKSAAADNWSRALMEMSGKFTEIAKANKKNAKGMSLDFHDAIRGMIGDLQSYVQNLDPSKQKAAFANGLASIKAAAIKGGMKKADATAFFGQFEAYTKALGKAAGAATATGFAQGVAENAVAAAKSARRLAALAKVAIMEELDAHSPSRVFIQIGKWVGQGFILGIESTKSKIATAANNAAKAAVEAFKAKSQAALDLATQTKDAILQFGSIVNADRSDTGTKSFIASMRQRLQAAQKFYRDLGQLQAMGLNSASLQEIISAGVEQGGAIAAQLTAGGGAAVNEVNSLEKLLGVVGGQIGDVASRDKYGLTAAQARAGTSIVIQKGGIAITFPSGISRADKAELTKAVDAAVEAAIRRVVTKR